MSPKEHDRTLIRRWRESQPHCLFLAPVSSESQQQNLPPVSPSLSLPPHRPLYLHSVIHNLLLGPSFASSSLWPFYCYASDQVHVGVWVTLPEGAPGPPGPKGTRCPPGGLYFTVAGPDRSSRVEIIQCFCLQEGEFVSGSGERCYSLGLLRYC